MNTLNIDNTIKNNNNNKLLFIVFLIGFSFGTVCKSFIDNFSEKNKKEDINLKNYLKYHYIDDALPFLYGSNEFFEK